jgi:hypothetical protein
VAPLSRTAFLTDLVQAVTEWWAARFGGWRTV